MDNTQSRKAFDPSELIIRELASRSVLGKRPREPGEVAIFGGEGGLGRRRPQKVPRIYRDS